MMIRRQKIINNFPFPVTQDRRLRSGLLETLKMFGNYIEQIKDALNSARGNSKVVLTTRLGSPKLQ